MERRRGIPIAGATVWVAPIEYFILRKLEYYRMASSDRHLGDIAAKGPPSAWLPRISPTNRFGLAELP